MKKLLFLLALSLAVCLPRAQAVSPNPLPHLGLIRMEALNQLTIASNDVVANKTLIKTLLNAVKVMDKTKTNYAAGAKTLATLNKTFSKTTLSNSFSPLIEGTVDLYLASFYTGYSTYLAAVTATYPGKAHDAALVSLARFLAAIDGANTNANFLLALKALGTAAKVDAAVQKAVDKAENALAPRGHFTATIAGSGEPTLNFKPFLGSIGTSRVGNSVLIIVQDGKISGGGSVVRQRVLRMNFPVQTDGTFTYTVQGASNNWDLNYVSSLRDHGAVSGDAFDATSGTLTVNVNVAAKSVIGSFSFSAPGAHSVAQGSNGSFSLTWQ